MPTRGDRSRLTVSEAAAVLTITLGALAVVVAVTAKLGAGLKIGGLIILAIGVGLLAYRILRGRPRDPDGELKPPVDS